MIKKMKYLFIATLMFVLPVVINAATVTVCSSECDYTTISAALSHVSTGDTLSVTSDMTAADLTLKSGITLDIPTGVTITLNGTNKAEAGSSIKNNGLFVVNGTLDISGIGYGTSGLISNQAGKMTIKKDASVKFMDIWKGHWSPKTTSVMFTGCEEGATIYVKDEAYVLNAANWDGAILVGETYYATLPLAYAADTAGSTIKLYADARLLETLNINKNLVIDLNGHDIFAPERVIMVQGASFELTGKGKVYETSANYGAINIKGSNVETNTNYTYVKVGKDVTLQAWAPIFITPYESSGNPYAYGVKVDTYGTLIAKDDGSGEGSHGIYVNGQIQHTTNYPVINVHDGSTITSEGPGIFAAGYIELNIGKASITGTHSGIGFKAGKLTIDGATVKATGAKTTPVCYSNGIKPTGAALQLESNSGYAGELEINIKGGSFKSDNANAVIEYLCGKTTTSIKTISISGGEFISGQSSNVFNFSDAFNESKVKFITGGKFNTSPGTYVAEGYKSSISNFDFIVSKAAAVPTGTVKISGTITNGEDAVVQLKQGGVVVKTTISDGDGKYTLSNVAAGVYNISISKDDRNQLEYVEVGKSDVSMNITFGTKNLEVFLNSEAPDVMINRTDYINSNNVQIMVAKEESGTFVEPENRIKALTTEKAIMILLSINILDNQNGGDFITETVGVLEFAFSFDSKDKENIGVIRDHNGQATKFEKLTAKPASGDAEDGTFYVDATNKLLYVYASDFSLYGITYTSAANPKTFDGIDIYVLIGIISLLAVGCSCYLIKRYN